VCRAFSRARSCRAVSKPVRPGICTSRSTTAKSRSSKRRKASSPESALDEVVAEVFEDRRQGEEVGGLVVHQEDVCFRFDHAGPAPGCSSGI